MPELSHIDHFVITVEDIEKSIVFYERVLGMRGEKFATVDGSFRWALKFGMSKINLHQSGAEFKPNAQNATQGSQDICFISNDPVKNWIKHFQTHDVEIELGPIDRTGATGAIKSLYIRDPDGNLIEISNYF